MFLKMKKIPYAWKVFKASLNDTHPKVQFDYSILMAKQIVQQNPEALVDLVKLIGMPYQAKYISHIVMKNYDDMSKVPNLNEYLVLFPKNNNYAWELYSLITKVKDYNRPLELKRDLILPWPWNKDRIRDTLSFIGEGRKAGKWKEDRLNHSIDFWLPMGIGWVRGGNHSIANGIVNGEGKIYNYNAYDMSKMYKYIYCDGEYFYKKKDNSKLFPVQSIEFACIFEIGRIMHENNISA
jgi:hypothetical protein